MHITKNMDGALRWEFNHSAHSSPDVFISTH